MNERTIMSKPDKLNELLFKLRTTKEVEHNDNQWSREFVYSLDEAKAEIEKHYISKDKVREAIGEDEPLGEVKVKTVGELKAIRNQLRATIRERLGLDK